MTERPPPLDAEVLLRALDTQKVSYVVIGGLAGVIYGSAVPTEDLDITPEASRGNLGRLAEALTGLGAKLWVDGQALDWPLDERSFDGFTAMTFTTPHGKLDVVLRPDAPKPQRYFDFETLDRNATDQRAFGLRVRVASLDDVMASKAAAGRPKDIDGLRGLEQLRRRLERNRDLGPGRGR